uniref:NADH-plastoquinone oxidoreductase subunit 4L n=1 Tax=Sinogentiana souliei TaxID=267666 RepID=A0A8F4XMX4_9GENT|nr:NADH-plastoquinone oxidoreductase subunit 4L [Sinogentiana souliei]
MYRNRKSTRINELNLLNRSIHYIN